MTPRSSPAVFRRPFVGGCPALSAILLLLVAATLSGDPPPTFRPLGMGLGGFAYWSHGPFANTMLTGGDWLEFGSGEWGSSVISWNNPLFDENGYPRYLNAGKKLRLLLWVYGGNYGNRPPTWPARNGQGFGKVVLTWRGDADVRVNGSTTYLTAESSGAATGRLVDGRRVYRFTTGAMSHLTVEEINASQPITEIKVWMPDPEDPQNRSLEGQFWHPTYLERLRDFDLNHVRTMDWGITNASPQQDWSDRRRPSHRGMHGQLHTRAPANGFAGHRGTGMAYEYMVKLANDLDRDLWICVPHLATDDYVTRLAKLVRFGSNGSDPYDGPVADPVHPPLAAHRRLYLEYSNEIWSNGNSFPQGNWAQDQANALGITKPQFNARRFCQVWRIFQEIFGGSERIVRVAAVWTGSSSYTTPFLTEIAAYGPTLSPAVQPDVIAPTTYFGNGIQDWAYATALSQRGAADAWFLTAQDFPSGSSTRPVSVPAADPYWASPKLSNDQAATFREWKRRIFSGSAAQGGGPDSTGTGGGFDESLRSIILSAFGRHVPLVSYEGGPSIYSDYLDGGDARDDGITTFLEALNRRPEFAEVYRIQLNMAAAKGLRCHSLFVDLSQWGKYGQWGHLEYPDQPPAQSVKWQAALNHEAEIDRLRHVDDLLDQRPAFTTGAALSAGLYAQPYSAEIAVSGGDYGPGQNPRLELIGHLLAPGLTVAPVPGETDRWQVRGLPGQGGPNYLYLRAADGDGDPAWKIFNFYVAGGAGTVVESDFHGTNPAMNLPWTKTYSRQDGLTFSGWQRALAGVGSGGTVGGRGIFTHNATDALKFSVSQGGQSESTSTLASALADDEYWKIVVTAPSGSPLDLRAAEVRFTYLRDEYHAPRYWAVFASPSGWTEGQQVYTSPYTTGMGDSVEYVFNLPATVAYQNLADPVELRFYPYGSQYAHRASLTGFKLTAVPATTPPEGLALWSAAQPWNAADPAPTADPDRDGLPNLLEYALGSDPLHPTAAEGPTLAFDPVTGRPGLTFVRLADPTLTYAVEATSDLSAQPWPEVLWTSTGAANTPGPVLVPDSASPSTSSRFLRLRVTAP